jgi:hypothetical protein
MTLDKHKIDGVPQIAARVLPAAQFDNLLIQAGDPNTTTIVLPRCLGFVVESLNRRIARVLEVPVECG